MEAELPPKPPQTQLQDSKQPQDDIAVAPHQDHDVQPSGGDQRPYAELSHRQEFEVRPREKQSTEQQVSEHPQNNQEKVPIDFVTLGMFIIGSHNSAPHVPGEFQLTLTPKMISTSFPHARPSTTYQEVPVPTQHLVPVSSLPHHFLQASAGLLTRVPISH